MSRGEYSEDFRSGYPGRSTVEWTKPSRKGYTTAIYAPEDSAGIDPTSFRKNALASDRHGRTQPFNCHHYDVHCGMYGERDSGHTRRGDDNFGSYDPCAGNGGGGDKLSRIEARMRMRMRMEGGSGGSDCSGFDNSAYLSRSGPEHRALLMPSRFDDSMRSFSSGRRHRDRSPPGRYFGPDNIGRSSLSYRRHSSRSYASAAEHGGKYESPGGYGGGEYELQGAYGYSNGYRTRIVTPGGDGGDYGSDRSHGRRVRRDYGRFSID